MPARHAGFAAVTVVSEALVNQVLATYVNTFLTGVRLPITQTVPMSLNGANVTLSVDASAALLSARARLGRNVAGLVPMTFRFFARPQTDVLRAGAVTPLASFAPSIVVEVDITAALSTMIQADHFQFGQLFGSLRQPPNVASGDEIATVLTSSGWLSRGVSYPTASTVRGGLQRGRCGQQAVPAGADPGGDHAPAA